MTITIPLELWRIITPKKSPGERSDQNRIRYHIKFSKTVHRTTLLVRRNRFGYPYNIVSFRELQYYITFPVLLRTHAILSFIQHYTPPRVNDSFGQYFVPSSVILNALSIFPHTCSSRLRFATD